MVLIKFWIIFHGDYEECPCFNVIQGPLTSVSGHRATTGPRLQRTSVTTRGRSNITGADTAGLASWGREINQVFPVIFFKLKSSWFIGLPWSQLVKNPPAMWETWVRSLGWEDPWGQGPPLQYSGLENSKDCIVHGVAKSRKRLSDCVDLQRYVSFWYSAKWFKYKYIYSFFLFFFHYGLLLCYIVNPYLFILYMTVSVNPKQWISPFIVSLFGNHMLFSVFVIVL